MDDLRHKHLVELLSQLGAQKTGTGSSQYQIVNLTLKIESTAQDHLKEHKHDYSAKRAVVKWVAARRRLQRYWLSTLKKDKSEYTALMSSLGLRG